MGAETAANDWCRSGAGSVDRTYKNEETGAQSTVFVSYGTITELHPCWVGNAANTFVPDYYINFEERVVNDGTLTDVWSRYGDAGTLARLY